MATGVKIVLIGKFCTNLRITKCSFTPSKLRFCSLAWHKISSIIYDFLGECRLLENKSIQIECVPEKTCWGTLFLYLFICLSLQNRKILPKFE